MIMILKIFGVMKNILNIKILTKQGFFFKGIYLVGAIFVMSKQNTPLCDISS